MKLLYGVGITDCPASEQGKRLRSYTVWKDILYRCYSEKRQLKNPTYQGCTVCDEWLTFSNFKAFYDAHSIDGYHLDKDLLKPDSRVYSPETCVFLPHTLNTFIRSKRPNCGPWPMGVCFNKKQNAFVASICHQRELTHLGSFESSDEAHQAWLSAKLALAEQYRQQCDSINPNLYAGLIKKIKSMGGEKALGQ